MGAQGQRALKWTGSRLPMARINKKVAQLGSEAREEVGLNMTARGKSGESGGGAGAGRVACKAECVLPDPSDQMASGFPHTSHEDHQLAQCWLTLQAAVGVSCQLCEQLCTNPGLFCALAHFPSVLD